MTHRRQTNDTIDVITVNYLTEEAINQLGQSLAGLQSFGLTPRLWIVDCSGTFPAGWEKRQAYPVTVLDPGANLGFGPACNVALSRCGADLCALVNPDCVVSPEGFALAAAAGACDGALAWTGVLLNPDSSVQCNTAPVLTLAVLIKEYLLNINTSLRPCTGRREVGGVTGALLFLDRRRVLRLGGFDETYPLYTEDVELTERLGRHGPVVQYENVVAIHTGAVASAHHPRDTAILLHASRIRFFRSKGMLPGLLARATTVTGLAIRALLRRETATHASPIDVWKASAPHEALTPFLPSRPVTAGPADSKLTLSSRVSS